MKKFVFLFVFFIFNLISLIFNLVPTHAAQFGQGYIRTDRQKTATQTTGLVCAEPVSTGIEGLVSITFPAGYSVSTSTSNWTVGATNLPDGATAWPGIGTATAVSGQTVTFPSSDLSQGTLYCFKWNKAQALTISSTGIHTGANITTKTPGSITIDSSNLTLNIIEDDQLAVSATVEPLSRAVDLKIDGSPETRTILSQDKEIAITISYRHNLPESYPIEINGEWDQGLIEGTINNYIDILDYEVGSASTASDGTKPVVDLANRRIIWNIPSLAASENFHQVSFKLKVRGEIPTDKKIAVKIKTRGVFVNSALAERSLTYTVVKGAPVTQAPTPASTVIRPIPLKFNFVKIDEIANTYFNISFQTNRTSIFTIQYGVNAATLNQKITGLTYASLHKVKLPDLLPNTQYYFRIVAKDKASKEATSDLFTATTASFKETVILSRDDFTVFWRKYFLLSQAVDTVVIPRNKAVTITARIGESSKSFRIKALFKNNNVLGISNIDPLANIEETPLVEILPGISSGEIQTPSRKGIYALHFGITDTSGGIYTKSAPYKFYVSDPLRVIDKKTRKPIENASVKILKYEEGLKQFTLLSNSFAIQSKTNENGELDIVLPTGVYSIEVTSPRYKSSEKRIELGISSVDYPRFELEQNNSFVGQAAYYKEELAKLVNIASLTIKDFFSSPNNKDLFLIFSALFLVFLILLNLHLRRKSGMVDRVLSFSIIDILEVATIICSLLFINFLGLSETGTLAGITLISLVLGLVYVRRAFFRKKS